MMMGLMMPFGLSAAAAGKVWAYKGSQTSNVDASLYTFTTCDIGSASADRRVIVGVATSNASAAPASVTVNGVTATHLIGITGTNSARVDLYIALVTSGTSVDIVVDPASINRCGIAWGIATGLSSNTPVDTDSSSASPSTATISTVADGFAIAVCSATATITWSGTGVVEDNEATYEASFAISIASAPTTGANLAMTATHGSTTRGAVFASF